VNIFDIYRLPLRSPDVDTGTPAPDSGAMPPATPGDARGEKLSIRQSLEKSFDDARKAEQPPAKGRGPDGKFAKGEKPKRAAEEMREGAEDTEPPAKGDVAAAPEGEASAEGDAPAAETKPATEPPAAWDKTAKAAWSKLPPEVQAAALKREADVQKGVDDLKSKYAEIDQALAPHLNAIRAHGHTPAAAVQQMFSWFQALSASPDQAFPALLKSFNYDPARLVPKPTQPAAAAAAPAAGDAKSGDQPAGEIPPAVQQYISGLEQKVQQFAQQVNQQLGGIQNNYQAQREAETKGVLANWSKDKPYFEKVRGTMAQLIQSGIVPLKDGAVDLDTAYDKAVWADPELRAAIQQEAQAKAAADLKAAAEAKRKADAEAAEKAKRASASLLGPGAPGSGGPAGAKPKKGKTARESILEAIEEHRAP